MARSRPFAWITAAVLLLGGSARSAEADRLTFEQHVRPILKAHCFHCHGEEESPKGELDLRLVRWLTKGGASGPALEPGDHEASLVWERVDAGEMPPGKKKLSEAEKETLARWIDQGAHTARPEPETLVRGDEPTAEEKAFWSFQPVKRPDVPKVSGSSLVSTPIDAFLLARLEAKGLSFSPEADPRTLIRRLSIDLTGLPPSPEEVDAFVADTRPDAYARLVDRLLASPAYGERWGRHWLDVAGYADSDGYTANDAVRAHAWRYRDYVVKAHNADRPWNDLIVEQLAGDELLAPPYANLTSEQADALTATGFLRMAPDGTSDGEADPKLARNDAVAETVKVASSALLGLTVGCAQCHAHRYDPISHDDYHRFRALFEPALDPSHWRRPSERLVSLWTDEVRAKAAAVDAKVKAIEAERSEEVNQLVTCVLEKELAVAPEELQPKLREARDLPDAKRMPEQRELLKTYPRVLVDSGNVSLYDARAHGQIMAKYEKPIAEAQAERPPEELVQALTEVPGQVPSTKLLARGDPDQPRHEVLPGELMVLAEASGSPEIPVDDPAIPTTGRRLAYARHLTSGKHPLAARVFVNRVWLHHFGQGIVRTPADFGTLGDRPSHPELLDWLADEFVARGWQLKPLHRLIVLSTAYRQSSRRDDAQEAVDPENRLVGRMNVRRLDAEGVRDALLRVSGTLQPTMGGPPSPVAPDEVGQVIVGNDTRDSAGRPTAKSGALGPAEFRRSLYVQVRRTLPLSVLEAFDAPAMTPNCELRNSSTVTPQALMMMNNPFVLAQAEELAARVEREAGPEFAARARRAWRLAFGVEPSAEQVDSAAAFLRSQAESLAAESPKAEPDKNTPAASPERQALASLCHALVSSNGFLYVD